ncbi:MAG TPA: TetR/AcrR family transcriptional regulator [Phenylobacterium sp.]|nr:TetR/AcrR family transcriptional regulator [Phenylobacterium sp.]
MKATSARKTPADIVARGAASRGRGPEPASKGDAIGKRIVRAAGTLLETCSPEALSMSEVARAAKVGRQTLYRRFSNKEEVLHSVFEDRAFHNIEIFRSAIRWTDHVADIIVGTAVLTLDVTSRDRVMLQMLMQGSSHEAGHYQLAPDSPMQRAAADIWQPILAAARERGALRPSVAIDDAILHIRAVHYILLVRTDIHPRDWPDYLRRYLLPVLLTDDANPYLS